MVNQKNEKKIVKTSKNMKKVTKAAPIIRKTINIYNYDQSTPKSHKKSRTIYTQVPVRGLTKYMKPKRFRNSLSQTEYNTATLPINTATSKNTFNQNKTLNEFENERERIFMLLEDYLDELSENQDQILAKIQEALFGYFTNKEDFLSKIDNNHQSLEFVIWVPFLDYFTSGPSLEFSKDKPVSQHEVTKNFVSKYFPDMQS